MIREGAAAELLSLSYSEEDWERESYALAAERAAPASCPLCNRTGFYGPRARDGGYRFRSCRFCGFTQEVGQPPTLLKPIMHDCAEWPECARAPYIWWVEPGVVEHTCPYCESVIRTSDNDGSEHSAVVPPSNDPQHPWWRVPQGKSYSYYLHFWGNWPSTKGRVIL